MEVVGEMMKYKIKEIAEAFNLSKQMIRYYEQCGVIAPKRQEDNNYRLYDTMDYFALSEAIALSRFNVNIKDIYALKANDYCNKLSECYRKFIKIADEELKYKSILRERAEELLIRTETAEMNVGNIWIKRVPAYRLYPLMKSHNDSYGEIEIPAEVNDLISSSDILPFCDGVIELCDNGEQWWLSIKDKYAEQLDLPVRQGYVEVEEQYCICVILNMGQIGAFDAEIIQKEINRIREKNYEITSKPRSVLLCRGSKDNEFRRLLELQVPIKKP